MLIATYVTVIMLASVMPVYICQFSNFFAQSCCFVIKFTSVNMLIIPVRPVNSEKHKIFSINTRASSFRNGRTTIYAYNTKIKFCKTLHTEKLTTRPRLRTNMIPAITESATANFFARSDGREGPGASIPGIKHILCKELRTLWYEPLLARKQQDSM